MVYPSILKDSYPAIYPNYDPFTWKRMEAFRVMKRANQSLFSFNKQFLLAFSTRVYKYIMTCSLLGRWGGRVYFDYVGRMGFN